MITHDRSENRLETHIAAVDRLRAEHKAELAERERQLRAERERIARENSLEVRREREFRHRCIVEAAQAYGTQWALRATLTELREARSAEERTHLKNVGDRERAARNAGMEVPSELTDIRERDMFAAAALLAATRWLDHNQRAIHSRP